MGGKTFKDKAVDASDIVNIWLRSVKLGMNTSLPMKVYATYDDETYHNRGTRLSNKEDSTTKNMLVDLQIAWFIDTHGRNRLVGFNIDGGVEFYIDYMNGIDF